MFDHILRKKKKAFLSNITQTPWSCAAEKEVSWTVKGEIRLDANPT